MSTPSYLRYANQGATRNLPLDPRLVSSLAFLGDMGITAEVYSGGQPAKGSGGKRVGSTRHDHGNAADVRFFRGDQQLDWARDSDRPFFEDIVRRGREAGITGFGAGPGYMAPGTMHIGFGAPGVWGAGGRAANAPDWLRNAYGGASAGPSAMALSPERSPSGAASALQSVMADLSSPSPSSPPAGGSMSTPTVNIGLKPERSTKLYDVMLERAMAAGSRSRNAWDVAGNLAQVWAANSEKKEAEAENASSLQEALAGLDPEYAAAAQLTGTREGAAQAFLSQAGDRREATRRAEDAARRQEETLYQRGRDTVGDQQWQAEQERLAQGTIPAGYRRTAEGMEAIPGGPADAPAETFRQATPEQAAQYGASGGQFGPDGRFYPINPPSGMSVETMPDGTMRMIQGPGAGKPGGALTEGQSKDAVFSTRARGALPTIDEFGEALTNPIAQGVSGLPGGNYMVGENFQRAQQAGNEFLQAILRKDTGAAITSQEVAEYGSVYLPRPGDSPATLQQKQQSRQRALAAIEAGMPPAAILQQEQALIQSGTPGAVQRRDENGVPVGGMSASPATPDQGTTVQRARNPQTGEVLELRNGQWVPAQ